MPYKFKQIPGAAGYQQSNPSALLAVSLLGSLEIFDRLPASPASDSDLAGEQVGQARSASGLETLRKKSVMLTNWLENKLRESKFFFDVEKLEEVFPGYSVTNGGIDVHDVESDVKTSLKSGEKWDPRFTIITPSPFSLSSSSSSPSSTSNAVRGAQLSLLWPSGATPSSHSSGHDTTDSTQTLMQHIFHSLKRHGVIGDEREPNVIRLSPAPLYNSFADCQRAVGVLEIILDAVQKTGD